MTYNWQQPDWPQFRYDVADIQDQLYRFAEKTGKVSGALSGLPDEDQLDMIVEVLVAEAVKTSQIEGELLSRQDVRSSVRNQLGLNATPETVRDARARGVTELMINVRNTYAEPLSEAMLLDWHRMLFSGQRRAVVIGQWRDHEESMQVISGPIGKETIHYEAPPSAQVPAEMARFIDWFNDTAPQGGSPINPAPVRSAITHLYFESIHPFEDGNGRIGRALSEKALAQALRRPVLLSLSDAIEQNREGYYDALKAAQRTSEVTDWVAYFVEATLTAQERAERQVDFLLKKARFFDRFREQLTERAVRVVKRMFDEGVDGFEGGMNARKYVAITKVSKATATRDLKELVDIGVLVPVGAGRSASYNLNLDLETTNSA